MEKYIKEYQTGSYLIHLIRSVLHETEPKPLPEGISIEKLYKMAKMHNVDYIAYEGVKKFPEISHDEYGKKWQERSVQCAMQGVIQRAERDKLYKVLPKAGVRILPLKGCLIKEMYPRTEYRQMADLDILIDIENAQTTRQVMEAQGYETEVFDVSNHDGYMKKPWCHVEIHRSLFTEKNKNAAKYENMWEHAFEEPASSGIYYLNWDDFYIYMLEHFAKHFRQSGSGIRSVMDIYVFLKEKGAELHEDYLEKKLKEQNLWEFKEEMEQIAEDWFVKGVIGNHKKAESRILESGAYGTELFEYMHLMKDMEEQCHSKIMARVIYVGKMIFLNYDGMCILYPVLKKVPFLLPFFWIYRIIKVILHKQGKIKAIAQKMYRMEQENRSWKKKNGQQ